MNETRNGKPRRNTYGNTHWNTRVTITRRARLSLIGIAALSFLLPYAHGADDKTLEEFLGRYVNDDTQELPKDVKEALVMVYGRGVAARWINSAPTIEILTPSAGRPISPTTAPARRKASPSRPAAPRRKRTISRPKRKP